MTIGMGMNQGYFAAYGDVKAELAGMNMENQMPLDPDALFDLYHALKELTTWWANWMPDNAYSEGGYDALQKARTALKKAEGKPTLGNE